MEAAAAAASTSERHACYQPPAIKRATNGGSNADVARLRAHITDTDRQKDAHTHTHIVLLYGIHSCPHVSAGLEVHDLTQVTGQGGAWQQKAGNCRARLALHQHRPAQQQIKRCMYGAFEVPWPRRACSSYHTRTNKDKSVHARCFKDACGNEGLPHACSFYGTCASKGLRSSIPTDACTALFDIWACLMHAPSLGLEPVLHQQGHAFTFMMQAPEVGLRSPTTKGPAHSSTHSQACTRDKAAGPWIVTTRTQIDDINKDQPWKVTTRTRIDDINKDQPLKVTTRTIIDDIKKGLMPGQVKAPNVLPKAKHTAARPRQSNSLSHTKDIGVLAMNPGHPDYPK
eukprot:1150620-Pelagomonas_calceolata.AAC.5